MAGLCEGGNEPPGSLKATCYRPCSELVTGLGCVFHKHTPPGNTNKSRQDQQQPVLKMADKRLKHDNEKEKKKLVGSLAEQKLPTEGCTGRNGEWEKSSSHKKISDERRH
ncbi:hypothetical protein ANN_23487 [Periplaneta americana]|uniref:Uncharacterized protein n=1 Tax=Periplaneta americana TaxID=6978 RepID=A0ABQ8SMG3_PERAM|nr:hypothetical protein ANN_23487 [Periplaneta americana]